jgi:hypothetical protein
MVWMMNDLLTLLATTDSTVNMINQIQSLTMEWMTAIVNYVNGFIKFIMPLMIYVVTFRIIISKS